MSEHAKASVYKVKTCSRISATLNWFNLRFCLQWLHAGYEWFINNQCALILNLSRSSKDIITTVWLYPYSHVKSTHWLKSGSLCKKGNTKYNRQGCVRSLNLDTRNKWKEIRKTTSDSPPPSTDKTTPALLHCSLAECCAPWGCYCPHGECCGCGYILSNWLLNNQEIKSRWEFRLFHLLYFRLLGKVIGSDKDTSEALSRWRCHPKYLLLSVLLNYACHHPAELVWL